MQAWFWETRSHDAWSRMKRVRLLSSVSSVLTITVAHLKHYQSRENTCKLNLLPSEKKTPSLLLPLSQKSKELTRMNNYANTIVMEIHWKLTAVKVHMLPHLFSKYLATAHPTRDSPQFTDPHPHSKLTRFSLSILCCSFCLLRALWYNLGSGTDVFNVLLLLGLADCLDSSFSNLWFSRSICLTSSFVKE